MALVKALGMELDIVRTVRKNQVNEISVCCNNKDGPQALYTVISVFSPEVSKLLATRIAAEGLFSSIADYVGTFTYRDSFNVVFRYHRERRLGNKEAMYAAAFPERKALAVSFLSAIAETELSGDIGRLLITEDCINISESGKVYLNYFFDFAALRDEANGGFLRSTAGYVFEMLTREYALKYEGQVEDYPNELRLMFKKIQSGGFKTLSQIILFVRGLSDQPKEQRFGVMRFLDRFRSVSRFIAAHPSGVFLALVVTFTAVVLAVQLGARMINSRETRHNTTFVGLETIGEVYLGEEDV